MSGSLELFSDSRRYGKVKVPAEKSSFAQTCNRLSQFLKEKGSLRDLGLEIAEKLEPKGRDLFPKMEKPEEISAQSVYGLMDLFPQHAGVGCPTTTELDSTNKANSSVPAATMEVESKTAPVTIFYGGQIFVFENFPADKAAELMLLAASGESCPNSTGFVSTPEAENVMRYSDSFISHTPPLPNPGISIPSTQFERVQVPQPHQAIGSDIPIARRASLHRFFDKRKDRVAARAPYQIHGGPSASSSSSPKHDEDEQLDLKL